MKSPILRGMARPAFEALVIASKNARIDIDSRDDKRVVQAIGDAKASAGFHHQDGILEGQPYTAAVDLSVRDLNNTQIATWLECLCAQGFVAFFRNWPGNLHIHGNYCGVPQKRQLDVQNEDFFHGRDGLRGHRRIDDEWWYPEHELRIIPEKMFYISNCAVSPRVCTRADVVPPVAPPAMGLYLNDEAKPRLPMPLVDGVSYAPVREWGEKMGFEVYWDAKTDAISYDGKVQPLAIRKIDSLIYAPIRQLARAAGLKVEVDLKAHQVRVSR